MLGTHFGILDSTVKSCSQQHVGLGLSLHGPSLPVGGIIFGHRWYNLPQVGSSVHPKFEYCCGVRPCGQGKHPPASILYKVLPIS